MRVSITCHEGTEWDWRNNSTLSLTSVLDGVGGQRHAPAPLLPGERHITHCTGGWVGPLVGLDLYGKSLTPPGYDPQPILTVQSLCTGLTTQEHVIHYDIFEGNFQFRVVENILH